MTTYEEWETNSEPSKRFKYLLGRLYDEYSSQVGEGYLSAARIRDRGFDFMKTDGGCQFFITRHLNAWSSTLKGMKRSVECWDFVLLRREFIKRDSRDWKVGDPD